MRRQSLYNANCLHHLFGKLYLLYPVFFLLLKCKTAGLRKLQLYLSIPKAKQLQFLFFVLVWPHCILQREVSPSQKQPLNNSFTIRKAADNRKITTVNHTVSSYVIVLHRPIELKATSQYFKANSTKLNIA